MTHFKDLVGRLLDDSKDVFGTPAEYHPKSGGSFKVCGIFDKEWERVDPDIESYISSTSPMFGIKLSDFPKRPRKKDKILIEDQFYSVIDLHEDGQGGASLILHKA